MSCRSFSIPIFPHRSSLSSRPDELQIHALLPSSPANWLSYPLENPLSREQSFIDPFWRIFPRPLPSLFYWISKQRFLVRVKGCAEAKKSNWKSEEEWLSLCVMWNVDQRFFASPIIAGETGLTFDSDGLLWEWKGVREDSSQRE